MVAKMTCYTYLGHMRNPRIYNPPPPQLRGFYAILLSSQKPRKMGEYCILLFIHGSLPCSLFPLDTAQFPRGAIGPRIARDTLVRQSDST